MYHARMKSALIDEKIKPLPDWRGKTLAKLRAVTRAAVALNVKGKNARKPRQGTD